jgi:hypothetical protein
MTSKPGIFSGRRDPFTMTSTSTTSSILSPDENGLRPISDPKPRQLTLLTDARGDTSTLESRVLPVIPRIADSTSGSSFVGKDSTNVPSVVVHRTPKNRTMDIDSFSNPRYNVPPHGWYFWDLMKCIECNLSFGFPILIE